MPKAISSYADYESALPVFVKYLAKSRRKRLTEIATRNLAYQWLSLSLSLSLDLTYN